MNEPTVTRSRGRTVVSRAARLVIVLRKLRLDEREREGRAVDGALENLEDVRHGADVVLVSMRQDQGGDVVLLQLAQVRDDEVDPEQLGLGEHHASIDEDGSVAAGDNHHVHAELAQAPERHELERRVSSVSRQKTPALRLQWNAAAHAPGPVRERDDLRQSHPGGCRRQVLRGWRHASRTPPGRLLGQPLRDRENSCRL